ncbi:hypothetical protein [Croceibacterium ferulae]|uniref:hypothetical protein n=1 Tax=Croceibacterium ferulae TaxID=1854641 RepID=UPI000EAF8877|nr:hypothetical protein [Croceibacterium ferulae]
MTKVRDPYDFPKAIQTIGKLIGWDVAGAMFGVTGRAVEFWGDDDKGTLPTLAQAFALDAAYVAAGGNYAPILESYARQFDAKLVQAVACRLLLARDVAELARESGKAMSECIAALDPNATPAQLKKALTEIEQVDAIIPRIAGRIKALLCGNGAAPEITEGENAHE